MLKDAGPQIIAEALQKEKISFILFCMSSNPVNCNRWKLTFILQTKELKKIWMDLVPTIATPLILFKNTFYIVFFSQYTNVIKIEVQFP